VNCKDKTEQMGIAVMDSVAAKHAFHRKLLDAPSFKEAMQILRDELWRQKTLLK